LQDSKLLIEHAIRLAIQERINTADEEEHIKQGALHDLGQENLSAIIPIIN
jgi:hypothetical protein